MIVVELFLEPSDLALLAEFIRREGREIGCIKIQYMLALDSNNVIILRDIIECDEELDFRPLLYSSSKHCLYEYK